MPTSYFNFQLQTPQGKAMSNTAGPHQVCVKVVGSLNWDIINQVESHYDELQHSTLPDSEIIPPCPGGHGVNQAVAVYRASHQEPSNLRNPASLPPNNMILPNIHVCLIGMIGKDDDNRGGKITNELREIGVDVGGVKMDSNVPTGYAHVYIDTEGKSKILNKLLANGKLTWEWVSQELEKNPSANLILVQLEIPQETVVNTIEYANKNKIPVIFNAAPASNSSNLYNHSQIFKVNHLILNHDCVEVICRAKAPSNQKPLESLTSVPEIQKRYAPDCDYFHKLGAQCVVITLGDRGVLASYLEPPDANEGQAQRTFFCPAKKIKPQPVDETGASDAFIGAYAVEIMRQMMKDTGFDSSATLDIGVAIEHGIKAGGLTTGNFGSFSAIPWRCEWEEEDKWLTANPFKRT